MSRVRACRNPSALACSMLLSLALLVMAPVRAAGDTIRTGGFAIATAPYRFVFPRDHAAHPAYQSEWWYYTGHLQTPRGRRFGYELTFFRFGLAPGDPQPLPGQSKWRGNQVYPVHFAITDEAGRTFFYRVRFAREALGMGHASARSLDVRVGDWTLEGTPMPGRPAFERMAMHAREATDLGVDAIDLVQTPVKGPAVHGTGGVSRKGPCASCASHYYSYTRLRTEGTLVFDGRRFAVHGMSWMDHEYGSSELQPSQAGWDWFSVQLADGRELMLYLLRQKDGTVTPQSSGSLIERNGSVRYLARENIRVAVSSTWHSTKTGATYPSRWRISVPRAGIDVLLDPTVADQELAVTTGGVSYWEGSVDVRDSRSLKPAGAGYVELTGYARAIAL